jgi:hypothetical protein
MIGPRAESEFRVEKEHLADEQMAFALARDSMKWIIADICRR